MFHVYSDNALNKNPCFTFSNLTVRDKLHVFQLCTEYFDDAPRVGELRTQKLKSHLVRTQSLNVLSVKPGVGQYIAIHATLTARDFFLAYSTLPVHSPAFFPKHLPILFLCWQWLTPAPV